VTSNQYRTTVALLDAVLGCRRPRQRRTRALASLSATPRWQRRALGPRALAARFSIPDAWAARICAIDELAERHGNELPAVRSARDALLLVDDLRRSPVETARVVMLDEGWRRMGLRTVAMGSVDRVDATPTDVFAAALRAGACAIILAHSHLCADPTPTEADRRCTERLRRSADLLGVPLLDHLVVSPRSSYSFAEAEGWPSRHQGYGAASHGAEGRIPWPPCPSTRSSGDRLARSSSSQTSRAL
jgi:hypothetical protein